MESYPTTVVVRHRLENLKKCSLTGLELRPDFLFLTYPSLSLVGSLSEFNPMIILKVEAPPLSLDDQNKTLLILDATWRYAGKMLKALEPIPNPVYRSLPCHYKTAYPRKQDDCPDPERGLSSIEAIYLSYLLLGRDVTGLLDHYYWRETFLQLNGLNN